MWEGVRIRVILCRRKGEGRDNGDLMWEGFPSGEGGGSNFHHCQTFSALVGVGSVQLVYSELTKSVF